MIRQLDAMEAGAALIRIFEQGVASGAISVEDMFDTGHNQRSYLIQSYARDIGNGKTVMMCETEVLIWRKRWRIAANATRRAISPLH
jgi:hypothetical protein